MNGWILSWFACTCQRKLVTSIIDAVVKLYHHRAAYNLLQKVTWSLFLTHLRLFLFWMNRDSFKMATANSSQYLRPSITINGNSRTSQGLVYCRMEELHQSWHLNKRSHRNIVNPSREVNTELRTTSPLLWTWKPKLMVFVWTPRLVPFASCLSFHPKSLRRKKKLGKKSSFKMNNKHNDKCELCIKGWRERDLCITESKLLVEFLFRVKINQ